MEGCCARLAGTTGTLRILIDEDRYVQVALLKKADALAMHAAVSAALRDVLLDGDSWWLVDEDVVIPLCGGLPDGCQLSLRTSSGKMKVPAADGHAVMPMGSPRPQFELLATPKKENHKRPTETREEQEYIFETERRLRSRQEEFFNLSNALSAQALRNPNEAHTLLDLQRVSKSNKNESNWRTIMAWVRTSLAGERTFLLMVSFDDFCGPGWLQHVYFLAFVSLAIWCVMAAVVGYQRFHKIDRAIHQKPTVGKKFYNRGTIKPTAWLLGIILSVISVSVWGHFIQSASKARKVDLDDDAAIPSNY